MGGLGGVMVGEEGEAGVERVTRGEHGGDGSTCDSGGWSSWWLSGAASVEGGWGGEREEREGPNGRPYHIIGRSHHIIGRSHNDPNLARRDTRSRDTSLYRFDRVRPS